MSFKELSSSLGSQKKEATCGHRCIWACTCLQSWHRWMHFEYYNPFEYCIFLCISLNMWMRSCLIKVKRFETFLSKKKKSEKRNAFIWFSSKLAFLTFNWKHVGMGLADCNKTEVTNSHPAILRLFCFYSSQIKTKRTFLWTLVPNQRPLRDFTLKNTL